MSTILRSLLGDGYDILSALYKHPKADTPEIRAEFLTEDEDRIHYCVYMEDLEDVWSKITNEGVIVRYCRRVVDREELWSKIRTSRRAKAYCKLVKDRPEVRKYITEVTNV